MGDDKTTDTPSDEWDPDAFKDHISETIRGWFATWRERGQRHGALIGFLGATVSLEGKLDEKARRDPAYAEHLRARRDNG